MNRLVISCVFLLASIAAGKPMPWMTLSEGNFLIHADIDSTLQAVEFTLDSLRIRVTPTLEEAALCNYVVGEAWRYLGFADSALSALQACSTVCSVNQIENDSLWISCNFSLANTYEMLGKYSILDAEGSIASALGRCANCAWCDSIKLAKILLVSGKVGLRKDGSQVSLENVKLALKIMERFDTPDSLNLAQALWWNRKAMRDLANSDEALALSNRLVKLLLIRPFLPFPSLGLAKRALADDMLSTGQPSEALQEYWSSVSLIESEFGVGSCEAAGSHSGTGQCLLSLGRVDEAEQHLMSANGTWEVCGEYNPPYNYVSALTQLGQAYLDHGRLDQAEDVLVKAHRVAMNGLAPGEDAFCYLLLELARLYDFQGELEQAERYYWSALVQAELVHSEVDPRLANFYEPVAEFLYQTNRIELALHYQTRAYRLRERIYGKTAPIVAQSLQSLPGCNGTLVLQRFFPIRSSIQMAYWTPNYPLEKLENQICATQSELCLNLTY
ncbi:MAG: hypothetical protein IPK53_12190 [bacterium]|nr:hypothetical protein [bacterium]